MKIRVNYEEPCVCGYSLEKVRENVIWRLVNWECPECGRAIATASISDSPVANYYTKKALFVRANHRLRKEKGLPPKKTIVTFYDDNGKRILWKDIVAKNKAWERRVGCVQRKPF